MLINPNTENKYRSWEIHWCTLARDDKLSTCLIDDHIPRKVHQHKPLSRREYRSNGKFKPWWRRRELLKLLVAKSKYPARKQTRQLFFSVSDTWEEMGPLSETIRGNGSTVTDIRRNENPSIDPVLRSSVIHPNARRLDLLISPLSLNAFYTLKNPK